MSPRKIDLINYLKGARFIERPLSAPSCVLDTNVVLDILLFADKNTESIQKSLASGQLLALGHYDTLYEFADVISRSQFKLTESQIKEKLHEIKFLVIQGQDDNYPPKPDITLLNKILTENNLNPLYGLYVGDSYTDYLTSINAHMDMCFCTYGYAKEEDINKIECIHIRHFNEIVNFIK